MAYRNQRRSSSSDIIPFTGDGPERLVASIVGMEGGGKTEFLKTCPRPLVVGYMDPNTADVLKGEPNVFGKEFRMPAFKLRGDDEDGIRDEAEKVVDEFREFAQTIMNGEFDPAPRTFALDTGTELWDSVLMADFGRTTKINPRDRGGANLFWRDLFRGMKGVPGLNIIVTHRAKQKWGTKEVRGRRGTSSVEMPLEGEYERVGQRETGNLVNVEALLMHDHGAGDALEDQFGIRILRCTQRPILIQTEKWGVTKSGRRYASFPWLARQVFPETSYEDWIEGGNE